jgi:hypothetical protein
MVKMKMALPIKGKPIVDSGAVFVVLQTHASPNETLGRMVTGAAIPFATDKATTCEFFKTSFSYTAPVITDTGEKPFLFKLGLLEYHHLSVAQWAWDLNESVFVVSDWIKPNGHGCTD